MAEANKKSESEVKVNEYVLIHTNHRSIVELEERVPLNYADIMENRRMIAALEMRVLALEKVLIQVMHTNTDDGSRHQNDGGWFD